MDRSGGHWINWHFSRTILKGFRLIDRKQGEAFFYTTSIQEAAIHSKRIFIAHGLVSISDDYSDTLLTRKMKTTRSSLLLALKEDGSDPLWAEFFHLYSPLITHTAKRSGLSNSDSDDIVQDVLLQIVSSIDSYTYDRNRGLFRAWLKTVTIHKIRDMQRRNKKRAQGVPSLDHIASPDDLELRWDDAFRRQLVQFALRKIRKEFRPRTWQCFVCHGLQRRPAAIVAQESGVTENAVYINTTRVMKRLREICAE